MGLLGGKRGQLEVLSPLRHSSKKPDVCLAVCVRARVRPSVRVRVFFYFCVCVWSHSGNPCMYMCVFDYVFMCVSLCVVLMKQDIKHIQVMG